MWTLEQFHIVFKVKIVDCIGAQRRRRQEQISRPERRFLITTPTTATQAGR